MAGLGGCPFTKVAGGNVCTEDLVHYLQRLGQRTEINLEKLVASGPRHGPVLRPRAAGHVYPDKAGTIANYEQSAIKAESP